MPCERERNVRWNRVFSLTTNFESLRLILDKMNVRFLGRRFVCYERHVLLVLGLRSVVGYKLLIEYILSSCYGLGVEFQKAKNQASKAGICMLVWVYNDRNTSTAPHPKNTWREIIPPQGITDWKRCGCRSTLFQHTKFQSISNRCSTLSGRLASKDQNNAKLCRPWKTEEQNAPPNVKLSTCTNEK